MSVIMEPMPFGAVYEEDGKPGRTYIFLGRDFSMFRVFILYSQPGDWWGQWVSAAWWFSLVNSADVRRIR